MIKGHKESRWNGYGRRAWTQAAWNPSPIMTPMCSRISSNCKISEHKANCRLGASKSEHIKKSEIFTYKGFALFYISGFYLLLKIGIQRILRQLLFRVGTNHQRQYQKDMPQLIIRTVQKNFTAFVKGIVRLALCGVDQICLGTFL